MSSASKLEKGFTLVELLIALFLGLFLIGGAIQIYLSSKQAYDELGRVTYLQENLRYITDTLTREFRHVDIADNPSGWAANTIAVQRDYDCSGGSGSYTLTYSHDAVDNELECNDGGGASAPVISNVSSMTVDLLNSDGDCLSVGLGDDPVGMCLTFVLMDTNISPNSYEVKFTVAFRNLVIEDYNSAP